MTIMEVVSLIIGFLMLAAIVVALRWFYLKMTRLEQNSQILIDELEALRKELNDRK